MSPNPSGRQGSVPSGKSPEADPPQPESLPEPPVVDDSTNPYEPARAEDPVLVAKGAGRGGVRGWLVQYLGLERLDLIALGVLLGVAFVFRFFSPIFPDVLAHPGQGSPISNCVKSTPIDPQGHLGTLCGLAYPYNAGGQPGAPCAQSGQVFDEVYFPCDAWQDLKGATAPPGTLRYNYFDPEPPFAKTVIAAGELSWGWFRATFLGEKGSYADLGYNTVGFRISCAVFGTLAVPLMYLLALSLWRNRMFAVAAGILCCFDGMFFVQSRIGMIDMIAIFFIMLAYWVYHLHTKSRTPRESIVTLILTGIAVGIAVSSKWIALAALGTMILFSLGRWLKTQLEFEVQTPLGLWSWRRDVTTPTAIPGNVDWSVYLPLAVVALILLPTVMYIGSWWPFFQRGQFVTLMDVWNYQVQSYEYHANLTATHPYGSAWYTWPFMIRPVAYYYQSGGLGIDQVTGQQLVAGMTDMGNPLIWWASIPCVLSLPYFIFKHRSYAAALILVGFLAQYLPWSHITRVIFLYHMFGGLIFMILALAFVLAKVSQADLRLKIHSLVVSLQGKDVVYFYLAVAVIGFLWFYPVWTALPISSQAYYGTGNTTPTGLLGSLDHGVIKILFGPKPPPFDAKMWFTSWI
ncbi:MAG TPA: phospholipid carrier-dependent glycosyltransferase [Candidatus Dormibacteraeota bacterium]|jgi:hypothetical protein|nr:phospholipid carrier-dependent glycosyltransferase [Candidatus Dormibacteraeota bacterium]